MWFPKWWLHLIKVKADCGHKTRLYDKISVFDKNGKQDFLGITITTKKPKYCHKCYEKMVIRCAWCGGSILPNDPITLYSPIDGYKIPEYAVIYKEDPEQFVGCLRWGCAESGGDRAGFWVMPGKIRRVLSPIEEIIFSSKDKVVTVSDLSDMNDPQVKPIKDD